MMVMEPVGSAGIWDVAGVGNEPLPQSSTFVHFAGKPPHLYLTTVKPDGSKLHSRAIYQLHGHRLTYCVAAPDYPWPTEFTTRPHDGCTLVTLKRRVD
jgi:hypothetical protein